MKSTSVWMICALALAGCVAEPVLIPARGASVLTGTPGVAFAEEAGIKVFLNGDAWRGDPSGLSELMTPIKVSIENRSGVRLRLTFQDISLLGASGFRYPALAPMTGEPKVSELVPNASAPVGKVVLIPVAAQQAPAQPAVYPRSRIHHQGFMVAPHYYAYYPGVPAWSLAFPYDPFYYQRYQDVWPTLLPTQDMLAEAMPEGVLEDGGRISGFVYFQNVSKEQQVRFEMRLVDASTDTELGTISVPFAVVRR
ncbi:MAG: hypothetical protein H6Q89_516 [Myxococcaceae bacterium]|nr:hypothetical protein [Myxococcaceae bacterium]